MSEFNEDILRLFAAEPVEKIAKAPRGAFSEFMGRYGLARPTEEYTSTAAKLTNLENLYAKKISQMKKQKAHARMANESDEDYAKRLDDVLRSQSRGAPLMESLKKTRDSLKSLQNKALTGRIVAASGLGVASAGLGGMATAPFAYARGRKRTSEEGS